MKIQPQQHHGVVPIWPKKMIAHSLMLLILSWSQPLEASFLGRQPHELVRNGARTLKDDGCSEAKKCKACKKKAIEVEDATDEKESCQWISADGDDGKKICSQTKIDEAQQIRCEKAPAPDDGETSKPNDAAAVASSNQPSASPSSSANNANAVRSNPPSSSPSATANNDVGSNPPSVSPSAEDGGTVVGSNPPSASPSAKSGGGDDPSTHKPTTSPVSNPNNGDEPSTNKPTASPISESNNGDKPSTNKPTASPISESNNGDEPTTNKPTASPVSNSNNGDEPSTNKPTASPNTESKESPTSNSQPSPSDSESPTQPTSKTEWKPDDSDGDSILDAFGKEMAGGTFLVVLLFLWAKCCRGSAADKSGLPTRAPPQASILGNQDNTKYQGVATADDDDVDPDEWGWGDDNDDTFEGDMELPAVGTSSPSHSSTQLNINSAAASPLKTSPLAAAATSPASSLPAISSLQMPSYKKRAPAPKPQPKPETDIFSEMGLAATPKFTKSLGATKLPQDSWGDDDLDDLLDD